MKIDKVRTFGWAVILTALTMFWSFVAGTLIGRIG